MDRVNHYHRCQLIRVIDGDTVKVVIDVFRGIRAVEIVRLFGINAPEIKGKTRDAGEAAKRRLLELIEQAEDDLHIKTYLDEKDKYGRLLAELFPYEGATVSLNEILVKEGHAVPYTFRQMEPAMNLLKRLKELLTEQAEKQGSLIFVAAKKLLVDAGCERLEEVIATAKKGWDLFCRNVDLPWVPEPFESSIEAAIWVRIEKGIRDFASKVCVADGATSFASMDPESLSVLVNDSELPA
jgi:micrococcal nuclease